MNINETITCPSCRLVGAVIDKRYVTVHNGHRVLLRCQACGVRFSETYGTPMEHLKSSISKVSLAIRMRDEGMGLRATGRVVGSHKNTIAEWEERFAGQKETLMLYGLCHEFLRLTFEGDELYTIIGKRTDPSQSSGWTAIIMERGSRFLVDQRCGKKDGKLFKDVMKGVCRFVRQTNDFSFFSDGERRYGQTLFELCSEVLKTGKRGRPRHVLPKGVKVRIKNKGSQKHKRGPKRPKYQAPQPEHPETVQDVRDQEIHANHLEGQNAATRRRNSAFRRRTNTYAKMTEGLQRTLDVHLITHNFVRRHWTTGEVP
ncbi:IS1 family transposase, partial [Candidatus Magnetominusculus xianensis]